MDASTLYYLSKFANNYSNLSSVLAANPNGSVNVPTNHELINCNIDAMDAYLRRFYSFASSNMPLNIVNGKNNNNNSSNNTSLNSSPSSIKSSILSSSANSSCTSSPSSSLSPLSVTMPSSATGFNMNKKLNKLNHSSKKTDDTITSTLNTPSDTLTAAAAAAATSFALKHLSNYQQNLLLNNIVNNNSSKSGFSIADILGMSSSAPAVSTPSASSSSSLSPSQSSAFSRNLVIANKSNILKTKLAAQASNSVALQQIKHNNQASLLHMPLNSTQKLNKDDNISRKRFNENIFNNDTDNLSSDSDIDCGLYCELRSI